MPSKKKKYNARFPAGRIKKIMQSDEEVGKVAQAVPIIISRTLELFVESLLTKTLKITNSRNAKTLSTSHMKQCIMSEQRFDFLRELVRNIPDISVAEEAANYNEEDNQSSPEEQYADSDTPYDLSMPSTSVRATSANTGRQLPQHHYQHTYQYHHQQKHATNGQNGGHDYNRSYLKRSMSSNPSSVIMHTTSLASAGCGYNSSDYLPSKLARSESTPVPPQLSSVTAVHPPRLKHQSYSMPSNSSDSSSNNIKPNIPPKPLRTPSQQTAALPAPIVSIDYCSKPVVKIDYSNLPLTAAVSAAPLSAPAHIASMSGNNSAFNFIPEPVINIDLSYIGAGASAANVAPSANTKAAVATISIGAPLSNTRQSRNSKASTMAEPSNNSPSLKTTMKAAPAVPTVTAPSLTANSDTTLELDEDYDNL